MSTLDVAIEETERALGRVDQLYSECPRGAVAERYVIKQASLDLGSALAALRQLKSLNAPAQEQESLL